MTKKRSSLFEAKIWCRHQLPHRVIPTLVTPLETTTAAATIMIIMLYTTLTADEHKLSLQIGLHVGEIDSCKRQHPYH